MADEHQAFRPVSGSLSVLETDAKGGKRNGDGGTESEERKKDGEGGRNAACGRCGNSSGKGGMCSGGYIRRGHTRAASRRQADCARTQQAGGMGFGGLGGERTEKSQPGGFRSGSSRCA